MNQPALTRPSEVRKILERIDFKPSKVLGQNFLIDQNILTLLLDYAGVTEDDTVLEVGPGLGVVTHALAAQAGRVIAVEKDHRLHRYLAKHLCNVPHIELIHADILDIFPDDLPVQDITKVVANLPYSISGRFLTDLCLQPDGPGDIVITVQKEVADRLAASPGGKTYGMLSVFAQARYEARVCRTISSSCFLPRPQVQSAIVHLSRRQSRELADIEIPLFQSLVKASFSNRRKQLGTIFDRAPEPLHLSRHDLGHELEAFGLREQDRPEQVPPEGWLQLTRALQRYINGS